jgi:methylthioribose-1-phosphate isomerase
VEPHPPPHEGTGSAARPFETLRWRAGQLELIDQRALPLTCAYRAYADALGVAEAIRSMVVRGAPAIGCAAAYGVALEAQRGLPLPPARFAENLEKGFEVLAASRPTAVNLFWALARMRRTWAEVAAHPPAEIAGRLLAEAQAIADEDVRANRALGAHGARLLKDGDRVLTHCNAGALATAGHGTALGVIRSAVEAGKAISVFVDETRPFLQGARLTAWELAQDHIPVTLVTDSMAGYLMSRGEVDAVVVGADRVAANGDVANKIGTYMLAVLAQRHGVPFYVAFPLSTLDRSIPDGSHIPIEERDGREVTGFGDVVWAPPGIDVRNPAFDVTPAALVGALITEAGVVLAPDAQKIAAQLPPEAPEDR